jgi:hypothetical protein
VPARKATARKVTARKATARKATARKATARKATARKAMARKATARKVTAKKVTAKKVTPTMSARPGDLIVIDSPHVGSPPREGEVLEVIRGEVGVSDRVRRADGHQSLIAPKGGTARIVRASKRA